MDRGTARPEQAEAKEPQSLLRWLGRTQNLDGSWQEDVERTAAALLAFIRAGNTPRKGSYRQVVRRSARWLANHPGEGWASFARVLALEALAQATGDPADRETAEAARMQLPEPDGMLQKAASVIASSQGGSAHVPETLKTLDDLRLAVTAGVQRSVPDRLLHGPDAELALTWAAGLPEDRI